MKKLVFWTAFWVLLFVLNVQSVWIGLAKYDFVFEAIVLSIGGIGLGICFVKVLEYGTDLWNAWALNRMVKKAFKDWEKEGFEEKRRILHES